MYVFGGFNSLLLSDILKYTPERCEAFDNETACLRAGPGVRCVWATTPPLCVPWENATVEQQQKVFEDCPPRPGMCHVLSVKARRVSFFAKFCLALCATVRSGLYLCFHPCPGDLPLAKWLQRHGDVSTSPSSCSCLLSSLFFFFYCTACPYFPVPNRHHQSGIRPGPLLCKGLLQELTSWEPDEQGLGIWFL